MSSEEKARLNQAVEKAVAEFRSLQEKHPDYYDLKRPGIDPTTVESVLRVDVLSNLGEACVSDIKVQLKASDPDGNKPFLVPWLEVDLLSGRFTLGIRDDRTRGGNCSFAAHLCRGEEIEHLARRSILKAVIAFMRRDGYTWPAEEIEQLMLRGEGRGWPKFQALFHQWIIREFLAAPAYQDNPWIQQDAMETDKAYAFAEIPPRGWLFVKVTRCKGYINGRFDREARNPETEKSYLEFAVDNDGLTSGPRLNDLSCHIGSYSGLNYQGKVFPIPDEVYQQMLTHVSPEFDEVTIDVPIEMPVWDKPLDSVTNCLERLHTEAFAYDEDQKWTALSFLAEHRDQLTEEVSFSVPSQPNNGFAMTNEARWQTIIDNSQKSCGCGCIRKLVPIDPKTGFDPNEEGNTAVGPGQTAYLIPKDGIKKQALMAVRVIESNGQHYLTFEKDPFSGSFDIVGMFQPKGYELSRLVEAISQADGEKVKLTLEDRTYCQLGYIDLDTNQVWLTPDASLRIEVE